MKNDNIYDGQKTSYKEYSRPKIKKYKNTNVIFTINSFMSYMERIAIGRFTWEGIDGNGIAQSRKVEEYLFYFKRCAIVDTNEAGLSVVKIIPVGINIYGEPAGYDIFTANGVKLTPTIKRKEGLEGDIGSDNAIILSDSQLFGRGCIDGVWNWAVKFADAEISVEQQLINQRAPLIAYTKNKNQEGTARVEIIDIKTGINALVIDENMENTIKPLNLESPFNVEKINSMQHEYMSRALNSLGIDSMQSFGKKEKLIVDEVESNDESLAMILSDCLKARTSPLENNKTAEKYHISCSLAKPYRISTYKQNHIDYLDIIKSPDEDKENGRRDFSDETINENGDNNA